MNKEFKKIIKDARSIKLTENEKKILLANTTHFVEQNPLKIKSPFYSFFTLQHSKMYISFAVLFVVISVGAGTSFAAKTSLPGDLLYPVKIHVNERLESFVSFSPGYTAQIETAHAVERLKEQEELAVKGDITPEAKAEIKSNFIAHVKIVRSLVDDAKARGDDATAAKITSDFETVINAHTTAAIEIGLTDSTDTTNTGSEVQGEVSPTETVKDNNATIDTNANTNAGTNIEIKKTDEKNTKNGNKKRFEKNSDKKYSDKNSGVSDINSASLSAATAIQNNKEVEGTTAEQKPVLNITPTGTLKLGL